CRPATKTSCFRCSRNTCRPSDPRCLPVPSWKKKRKKKGTRATCALRRLDHFVTPCFVPSPSDARHTRAANFLSRHVECVLSHTRNFQHFPCFINTYARSMHAGTRLAE